jgi:hypothetical protein
MEKKFPIHLNGVICWLPPHKPGRVKFPPNASFRAMAMFTSDLSFATDGVVNYSPFPLNDQVSCFEVRLSFPFLANPIDEIRRLSKNSEILIMDAYKVIAVCRNIALPEKPAENVDDEWLEKTQF